MSKKTGVAVVGVSGLAGDMLISMLEDDTFAFTDLHLVDADDEAGERRMIKGQSMRVEPISRFDFSQVAVVVIAGEPAFAQQWAPVIKAAGAVLVDTTGSLGGDPVVAEVNPQALASAKEQGVISAPDSQVVQSAIVLHALAGMAPLQRVSIATYQSMSTHSRAAVEALAMQTSKLLNGQPAEKGVLDKQAAFNLSPCVTDLDETGASQEERALVAGVQACLGAPALPVLVNAVLVPVFYGTAQMMQVSFTEAPEVKRIGNVLRRAKGIKVLDKAAPGGFPTPITDATGSDAVWVGRIRADAAEPNTIHLWIVSDNLRKGVAINSLMLAELLIKDYL
ncbi:MAG: aspartate-semialdehyde dehydrogenase [Halopseudomonas sp.]|uniref:aspartate-semialdehyde dehydrogenase n=1 Tax=Halopseudomonas sp. TaxID=2901191 RepID=UPI003000FEB7